MGKRKTGSRLSLHRETVRVLGSDQLARVAGGTVDIDGVYTAPTNDCCHTNPKTTAWTAGSDDPVANRVCGSLVG
jgi:hypothetical protein